MALMYDGAGLDFEDRRGKMTSGRESRASMGGIGGGEQISGTTGAITQAAKTAAEPGSQGAGFASLPRNLQAAVEQGRMSLEQATAQAAKEARLAARQGGPSNTAPSPAPNQPQGGGGGGKDAWRRMPGGGPGPGNKPEVPTHGGETGTNVRLGKGQLSQGPGTFARPGSAGFQPFMGRAFGKNLLEAQGGPGTRRVGDLLQALEMRRGMDPMSIGRMPQTGISTGSVGQALGGMGGGGNPEDDLINYALQAQGLM